MKKNQHDIRSPLRDDPRNQAKRPRVVWSVPGYWTLPKHQQQAIDDLMARAAEARRQARKAGERPDMEVLIQQTLDTLDEPDRASDQKAHGGSAERPNPKTR